MKSISIKKEAFSQLMTLFRDFQSFFPDKEFNNKIFKFITQIIEGLKVPITDPNCFDTDRIELRKEAVQSLEAFEQGYDLNIKVLQDSNEHRSIREAALANMQAFKKSAQGSKIKNFFRLRQIENLLQTYQNIPDLEQPEKFENYGISDDLANINQPTEQGQGEQDRVEMGGEEFKLEGEDAPTPRIREGNSYVNVLANKTDKTRDEMWKEIDSTVLREHYKLARTYGFVPRESGPEAEDVYDIFERLKVAYDQQADLLGLPHYQGKLFIVDSPEVNAHVFSGYSDVYITLGLIRGTCSFLYPI